MDFTSFFMAFGTICFAFGGHPAFPTFQADMINQKHFGRAVLLGYLSMKACIHHEVKFVWGIHLKVTFLRKAILLCLVMF